jgi:hypothetical protein
MITDDETILFTRIICPQDVLRRLQTCQKIRQRRRFETELEDCRLSRKNVEQAYIFLLTKDLTRIKEVLALCESEIHELKEADGRLWSEWHDANERLIQSITRT